MECSDNPPGSQPQSESSPVHVAEEEPSFYKNLAAYRQSLLAVEQAMQSEYDKNVMLLSGGALGLSMVFTKDIVGTEVYAQGKYLLAAWILWGLSISFILSSFFTSTKAIRKAITDTDLQDIYLTLAKSRWATATKWLNLLGGSFFFLGVIMLVVFVACNLRR